MALPDERLKRTRAAPAHASYHFNQQPFVLVIYTYPPRIQPSTNRPVLGKLSALTLSIFAPFLAAYPPHSMNTTPLCLSFTAWMTGRVKCIRMSKGDVQGYGKEFGGDLKLRGIKEGGTEWARSRFCVNPYTMRYAQQPCSYIRYLILSPAWYRLVRYPKWKATPPPPPYPPASVNFSQPLLACELASPFRTVRHALSSRTPEIWGKVVCNERFAFISEK